MYVCVRVCVCACVCARACVRERERESVCVCMCGFMCGYTFIASLQNRVNFPHQSDLYIVYLCMMRWLFFTVASHHYS